MREALIAAREAIAGGYQSRTTDEVLALIEAALAEPQAPAPVPAGWRLLKNSTHDERSFPEDSPHENGWYSCECSDCGRMFNGHKRRITCKVCSMLADEPEGEMK